MASSSSSSNDGAIDALLARADEAARAGRIDEVIATLQQAAWHPDASPDALRLVARGCVTLRLPAAAIEVQQRIATMTPRDPAPWHAMAALAAAAGLDDDARHAFSLEGAARAGTAHAYAEVAMQRWRENDFARARDAFARARGVDARYLPARWGEMQLPRAIIYANDADAAAFVADWRRGLAWFEAFDLEGAPREELASCVEMATNFYLHYHGEPFVDEQRRYARVIERMMARLHPHVPVAPRAPSGERVLRVGFCSSHFRHHTVLKLFRRLVTGLPRDRFHVSAFHTAALRDRDTDALAAEVDAFDAGERSVAQWLATLRAARLDALVHLDVGMQPMAQALASRRIAPWQAVAWGHPVTTGFGAIDAVLSGDAMEPPDADAHYTETLVRLPHLGIDFAPPAAPFDALGEAPPVARDGVRVFVAQQAFKLMPAFDVLLARIVRRAPALRLHMTPHASARVRDPLRARMAATFAAHGLSLDDHLAFFGTVSEAGFFHLASRMDANFDTPGWSGGNTTLEILWHDVPTVTREGPLMRQRHTAAMLRRIGLDELVATDDDAYVDLAVRLVTDAPWRTSLRAHVAREKARLYDDPAPVAALADVITRAVGAR